MSHKTKERWLTMQDTIRPFALIAPTEPVLIDVAALEQRSEQVPDVRQARGTRYRLSMLLTIAVLAKLVGHDTTEAIADWAARRAGGVSDDG